MTTHRRVRGVLPPDEPPARFQHAAPGESAAAPKALPRRGVRSAPTLSRIPKPRPTKCQPRASAPPVARSCPETPHAVAGSAAAGSPGAPTATAVVCLLQTHPIVLDGGRLAVPCISSARCGCVVWRQIGDNMATRVQISCVTKSDRFNPHERITHIGGRNPDGSAWKLTQEQAIQGVERDEWRFYTLVRGEHADVIVAVSRFGNKYLKTVADGEQPDNLLSLPECV
jgi:hypothetical protein